MAQLGMVLEDYPDAVIIAVTSPRTGLQRRSKWPPSIAEVVEACEAEVVSMDTSARYAAMQMRPEVFCLPLDRDRPGRRANVFVPLDSSWYGAAAEWSAKADPADWKYDPNGRPGIWVSYDWWVSRLSVRADHVHQVGEKRS